MIQILSRLLVASSLLALACGSSGTGNDGTITGVVILSGASDASGVLVSSGNAGTVTAADGSYSLRGLGVGSNVITAVAASTREGSASTRATLTTNAGTAIAPTLTFTALGGIKGLIDLGGGSSGNGGATVVVEGSSASAVSDATGAFAIAGVTAGAHSLLIAAPGFVGATPAVTVVYNATADAGVITLAHSFADGTLTGTITVNGATQLAGLAVVLSGPSVGATTTDASGNYAFVALADGVYSVSATVDSTLEHTLLTRASVQAGAGIASTLEFTGLGNIAGVATLDGATTGNSGIAVSTSGATALTDDSGNYDLQNIPAGAANLTVAYVGYSPGAARVDVPWNDTVTATPISLAQIVDAGN